MKAGNAGVTLNASHVTVAGRLTSALLPDGETVAGNRGDGIQINASSHGDLIGQDNPVSGIDYYNSDGMSLPPSGYAGIRSGTPRAVPDHRETSATQRLALRRADHGRRDQLPGELSGAASTNVYGPDLCPGAIGWSGTYRNRPRRNVHGFLFQGTTANLDNPADYPTIDYQPSLYNYDTLHSMMGGLIVGNASQVTTGDDAADAVDRRLHLQHDDPGLHADLLSDRAGQTWQSNTAFGIWYNGGTSYTIVGGYKQNSDNPPAPDANFPFGTAYMVDYNSATGAFSNWTSFNYPGTPAGMPRDSYLLRGDQRGAGRHLHPECRLVEPRWQQPGPHPS